MPFQVLKQIRKSARQLAYNSPLYDWSLRGGDVPDRLVVRPVDPWPGQSDHAYLVNEYGWEPVGAEEDWLSYVHGFAWLRDFRAVGNDAARRQARAIMEDWIHHYRKWNALSWRGDIAGERVALWIALFEFFGGGADEDFHDIFFESLICQARHLQRALPGNLHGLALLKGIKGLLYAGLAFEGRETWVEQALDLLSRELDKQILSDGSHVSRAPDQLLTALQILLDVRSALASGDYPLPEKIQHAIDRMGPAVKFFRFNDKRFAMFNGAQEGDESFIDCVLAQAGMRGKALHSLPSAGFERVSQSRTHIIFDCGKSPAWPYDERAHAAPLAFEMSYGKDRVIVSCGSHPVSYDWQEALRATAAHTTLGIDHRNACEIKTDRHMSRKVREATPLREESKNACLLEGTHDGYVPLFGVTHRRRLYLSDQGHDLRGEDRLSSQIDPVRPLEVAIRFHIHPRVLVSLIQDGEAALLRLPTGIGWRFQHSAGTLALEDSIYLGEGTAPRKTKQLVIYGQVTEKDALVKWALRREGV